MSDRIKIQPTVYVETTISSYATGRPSRDVVVLGNQEITRQWWQSRRTKYRLFISTFVIDEASDGDAEAAERRLSLLQGIDVLGSEPKAEVLAASIAKALAIPKKARLDAYHIAYAMFYELDYF